MTQLNIVFVDDEEELCEMYEDLFDTPNRHVKAFSDIETAKNYIESNPIHLAFIDYRMPGMSGPQFRQLLDADLPCIVITGEFIEMPDTGFVDLLSKPVDEDKFNTLVDKHARKLNP